MSSANHAASTSNEHSDTACVEHADVMQLLLALQVSPLFPQAANLLTLSKLQICLSHIHACSMNIPIIVLIGPAVLLRGLWTGEGDGRVKGQEEASWSS